MLHAHFPGATVLAMLLGIASAPEPTLRMLEPFDRSDAAPDWRAVDDRVMGGVSRSGLVKTEHGARFTGRLSLEQGGGFASVRSPDRRRDLSGHRGLVLRIRGDGRRYKLSLRTDGRLDGVVYQQTFATVAGEWRDVYLPFDAFRPSWRGHAVPGAPALDRARVTSLGLLVSDRQHGTFSLDVAWIAATPAAPDGRTP